MTSRRYSLALAFILVWAFPCAASADVQRPLADAIPQESLVAYIARPYDSLTVNSTSTRPVKSTSTIATVLAFLNAGGMIPDEGQIFADIAAALPLLGTYDHALVLLDASSRVVRREVERPGDEEDVSLRLKHLEAFVLLRTGGTNREILEHLNRIVARYTHRDVAKLDTLKASGFGYQRLTDSRIPEWAVWEWGEVGDFYALCFGRGAFAKVAAAYQGEAPRLSADPWYARTYSNLVTDRTLAHWFIGFERLARRLGEISQPRIERVLTHLEAKGITRDMWVVGLHDRALSWSRCYEKNGENFVRRYSDPAGYSSAQLGIVPDAARHYAILDIPSRWLVDNVPQAWVATGSMRGIEQWQRIWNSLESQTGIDLSRNLTDHLGDHIILFDYPVHPLEIPFAMTIAVEIEDDRQVRMAVDAVLGAWSQYLDELASRSESKLARVSVHRDNDGVWYLQAGILGPAIKISGKYAVISWSPTALRQALRAMKLEQESTSAPPARSAAFPPRE